MKRGTVAAVLTVLFAVAAAAAVFLYVDRVREDAASTEAATIDVIVSTQDIAAGQDLEALVEQGAFVTRTIPVGDVVQGAVTDVYQLRGQRSAYPILAGEQIPAARFVGPLQAEGGALGIPPEHQAVSVTLDPQRVVAGNLQQGDLVEIFGSFIGGPKDQLTTRVVIPDALVLQVSNDAETGAVGTITLAVTPEEASRLVFAQEQGRVWFTLLPPNEAGVELPPVFQGSIR